MLRHGRIRFAEAEFNEHILVVALILLRRMHPVVAHEIVAVLRIVWHGSITAAATARRRIRPRAAAKG